MNSRSMQRDKGILFYTDSNSNMCFAINATARNIIYENIVLSENKEC